MATALQSAIEFQVRKCSSRKGRKLNKNDKSNEENCTSVKRNLFENLDSCKKPRTFNSSEQMAKTLCSSPTKLNLQLKKQDTTSLQAAKQVFHTSLPSRFIGREQEISEINYLLQQHLNNLEPLSMYISGAPGTGKTSCLMYVLKSLEIEFRSIFINCMTVNSSHCIYKAIANELGLSSTSPKCIQEYFRNLKHMTVLVLDEIDHLDSKDQEVLYSVFEWPQMPNSKLILIGVANALDLTDRVLPRLQAFKYEPHLMHFRPYSHEQITKILEDRLKDLQSSTTIIRPSALQLCARKIAACTGDIRKALQVCRRAIELAEKQARSQRILTATSENSPVKQTPVVTVDLVHVTSVLNEVYGSRMQTSSLGNCPKTVTLPLQQVILLCSLILMKKCLKSKDMCLGKLYDVYKKICVKRQISEVGGSEFYSLCQLVEVRGFIRLTKNKIQRMTKVILKIDEKEAEQILQDKTLLVSILADTSVVGKK